MRQKRGRQSDGTEQIGCDRRFCGLDLGFSRIFRAHDAGIIEDDVERWKIGRDLFGKGRDCVRVGDVEFHRVDAGIGCDHILQFGLVAAGDDHVVAFGEESFGERAAYAAVSAGDQDGVAGHLHKQVSFYSMVTEIARGAAVCLPYSPHDLPIPPVL